MVKKSPLELIEKKVEVKGSSKDFADFFKSRKGLWVSSDFKTRILEKAAEKGIDMPVASYKLVKDATDEEIEAALPKKHIFSESEVCTVIAGLIENQPKGEKGILLNDGWYNLFYTPSFVVLVRWRSDDGEWRVCAWGRVGGDWGADCRVFYPATDADA